jgi:two-component system, OmpR family, sensor histidine kinase VicK
VSNAEKKIDSVIDSTAPSVMISIEGIKKERFVAKQRGVKFRYVTEISKDNVAYCKEMLKFSDIRHLDRVKGNFEISDNKEYVAMTTLQKAKPIPQLIYSNVKDLVEQQQYVFDSFWNRAIPAEQKIRELELGVVQEVTEVIANSQDAKELEWHLLKGAKEEIQLIYSTANSYHIQERAGTIQLLTELAQSGVKVNMLTPMDPSIEKSVHNLVQESNIAISRIEPTVGIKFKSVVVDRKYSLIMEIKHESEQTFTAAIGLSSYSTSRPTILSYISIFDLLSRQSELQESLRQTDSLKKEFINVASHELRTPIMPIINGLEILEEKLSAIQQREHEWKMEFDIIRRNAQRLQKLSEDILQVSRMESGRFTVDIQKNVDINSLISDVIKDIETKYDYGNKKGRVSIDFVSEYDVQKENEHEGQRQRQQEQNIIDTKKLLLCNCDPGKVSEVIFNLLDNSMKFTEQGKITVSAKISSDFDSTRNNNKMIVVSILDQGIGIDLDVKDKLFDKFITKSQKGVGLGLYISRRILEAHGGRIWIDETNSNSNNKDTTGAKFTFTLPLSQQARK